MANGNGTVYLRGKTWTIGLTTPTGLRVREAVGSNRRLAEMVLKKRMTEVLEGRYFPAKAELGRMPFSELGDLYLERVTSQQKSARSEGIRVSCWMRHFGQRQLGSITRDEIEDWQRSRRQHARPATTNRDLCRLRHMLNKAVEWKLLAENPMKSLKFLPENNARQRYLTLEECERLIQACLAPWVRAIVIIGIHTGMRLGEILRLRHQDLNLSSGFILIPDSKNGEPRHVPMDSTVAEILGTYPYRAGTEYIFTKPTGTRFLEIRTAFRNALKRAGLEWAHFHDLRHTFASHWMMNGGDLYVLKTLLGHKSISMTQRYAHLSPEYKRAAVNRMDNMWATCRRVSQAPSNTPSEHFPVTVASQGAQPRDMTEARTASDAGLSGIN